MLQISRLNYAIGERYLFNDVNWTITPGRRSALIGPNGAGKTTLLRVVNGDLQPDSMEQIKPKDYVIGFLPQEEISIERGSILEVALEGQGELLDLEEQIYKIRHQLEDGEGDHDALLKKLGTLESRYEVLDGYKLESSIKAILSGLGFAVSDFHRPISDFSGGWRMRVYLARLLIQKPDLLLLDEPTNHLDLPSLEWLEQYLLSFSGSMVIVSHDRYFIERLCNEIYELDRGKLTHYPGNYHDYERRKEENLELLMKRQEEVKAKRQQQEEFIDRFRYKASKAKQVQSRVKQLNKLEDVVLPPPPRRLNFKLSVHQQSYKEVLHVKNMSFKYEKDWVLENVDMDLYRGEKLALVGVNGAGKTTLTRLVVGQLEQQQGEITVGQKTDIGYYAQHQVDTLDLNATVYDEVCSSVADSLLPQVRDVLGVFQFTGDDVFKKVGVLSGGEKARVSLAKILMSPVNFLIMDEPTNHLDMASKEALEHALKYYDGTVILISHDRYFLDKLVTRVIEIKEKHLRVYEGNYSDYLHRRQQDETKITDSKSSSPTESTSKTSIVKKSKEDKRKEAEARQAISKKRNQFQKIVDDCEAQIEILETRIGEIETLLADPETYKDGPKAAQLQKEYADAKNNLQQNMEQWETAQMEIEELLATLNEE